MEIIVICHVSAFMPVWCQWYYIPFGLPQSESATQQWDSLSEDFGLIKALPWHQHDSCPKRAAIYQHAEIESRYRKAHFQNLLHDHTGLAELECIHADDITSFKWTAKHNGPKTGPISSEPFNQQYLRPGDT